MPADRLNAVVAEHGLQEARRVGDDNVILRAVPVDAAAGRARLSADRGGRADLSFYPDSRSARAGHELLAKLDREPRAA